MQTPRAFEALDAEELFTLGLRASNTDDSAGAINLLKLAVERDPQHARAAWLLGAEYAQIGLTERALAALTRAVETDSSLVGARFQLGLLHLTSGHVEQASAAWAPLDDLADNDPHRLFKTGMLDMVADRFDAALTTLRRCAALTGIDAALKRDVEMVIEQIETRAKVPTHATSVPSDTSPATNATDPSDHLFLTAYRGNRG
ncbi:hypothetical protein [Niveibacterium sp. COAC-50]|uniref:hypothetical protein n=1 Tax=Niveibacterium sp. COAC-50 TaxID=2729384 RepID=UPI00155264B3|nr:hypothetical protein [Niveibacterium sp. COAC-50]